MGQLITDQHLRAETVGRCGDHWQAQTATPRSTEIKASRGTWRAETARKPRRGTPANSSSSRPIYKEEGRRNIHPGRPWKPTLAERAKQTNSGQTPIDSEGSGPADGRQTAETAGNSLCKKLTRRCIARWRDDQPRRESPARPAPPRRSYVTDLGFSREGVLKS
jgi:hypothetical protein